MCLISKSYFTWIIISPKRLYGIGKPEVGIAIFFKSRRLVPKQVWGGSGHLAVKWTWRLESKSSRARVFPWNPLNFQEICRVIR